MFINYYGNVSGGVVQNEQEYGNSSRERERNAGSIRERRRGGPISSSHATNRQNERRSRSPHDNGGQNRYSHDNRERSTNDNMNRGDHFSGQGSNYPANNMPQSQEQRQGFQNSNFYNDQNQFNFHVLQKRLSYVEERIKYLENRLAIVDAWQQQWLQCQAFMQKPDVQPMTTAAGIIRPRPHPIDLSKKESVAPAIKSNEATSSSLSSNYYSQFNQQQEP